MSGYYLQLALQNLRRHVWLTVLIVLAISIGLGSSMTMYSILRAMSSNPIAWKAERLHTVQFDNFGSDNRPNNQLPVMSSYKDVIAFHRDMPALHKAGMFEIAVSVATGDSEATPVLTEGRATHADFFSMFEVPFDAGQPWSAADDEARANVVVLTRPLAARLFPGADAVGKTLSIEAQDYRVIGVTNDWAPSPRFYDVGQNGGSAYDPPPELFLPLETALERRIQTNGSVTCLTFGGDLRASECIWLQFWLEVEAGGIQKVHDYLQAYGSDQQRSGRLGWKPEFRLPNVSEWLVHMKVAPDEIRVATWVAAGFLLVCLVNAGALMLARSSRRAGEFSLRRALGASRRNLFQQGVWESLLVGLIGGAVGLLWTWAGLVVLRGLVPKAIESTTRLQPAVVALTVLLALIATVVAGLFPAWRASRTAGALRLKSL